METEDRTTHELTSEIEEGLRSAQSTNPDLEPGLPQAGPPGGPGAEAVALDPRDVDQYGADPMIASGAMDEENKV